MAKKNNQDDAAQPFHPNSIPQEEGRVYPMNDSPGGANPASPPEAEIHSGMVLKNRYIIGHELGRGGIGVVYQACDKNLHDMPVVIKVLLANSIRNEWLKKKFQQEIEALARITHPGVVKVLDRGEMPGGQPFFAMEFVKGRPLRSVIKKEGMDFEYVAQLVRQISRALSAAHEQGVYHRDLKPENIMLQTLSNGEEQAKLIDFGIAKIENSRVGDSTVVPVIAGSLHYMAPEQLQQKPVSAATDIYALGVIAYEMITGQCPFNPEATDLWTIRGQILEMQQAGVKVKPRDVRPDLPIPAQEVILKALSFHPEDRYTQVQTFGEDLARALERERPIGPEKPGLLRAIAIIGGLVMIVSFVALVYRQWRLNWQMHYIGEMKLVQQDWENNNVGVALERLDGLRPGKWKEDLRGFEWYYFWRLCHSYFSSFPHSGEVWSVALSPDGKTLAAGNNDQTIKLWDMDRGQEITQFRMFGQIWSVAFSPDGKTLAAGSDDGDIKLWDVGKRQELATLEGHQSSVRSVAFSPDGKLLATGSEDGAVKLWDVAKQQELTTLAGTPDIILSLTFSPDGKTLATGGAGVLRLWDVATRKGQRSLQGHESAVRSVAFSPNGKLLATGSEDKTVKLWEAASGQELATLKGHTEAVWAVAFAPDGKTLATGSKDKTIKLWNVGKRQEVITLKGHRDSVRSIAFSPDGRALATGSQDKTVRLWDVFKAEEPASIKGNNDEVWSVAFSPDVNLSATGGEDSNVKLLDIARQGVATLKGREQKGSVYSVAFSPDGRTLATGSQDKTVRLWDVEKRQELATLEGHQSSVRSVAFSPDGKLLATGSEDGAVKLWDVAKQQELTTLAGTPDIILSLTFSPDGKTLATGSVAGVLRLWDVATRKGQRSLQGHESAVRSVAFSPNGKLLATGSEDKTVKLWEAASGQELATLKGHTEAVWAVAFAPDGKTLATGSKDKTIKLWNVATSQEMITLNEQGGGILSVAFSRDNKTLATGSRDGTVKLWRANSD